MSTLSTVDHPCEICLEEDYQSEMIKVDSDAEGYSCSPYWYCERCENIIEIEAAEMDDDSGGTEE